MIKNNGDVANYKQLIFGVALMIILLSLMILLILIVFIILFPIYVNVHLSFINGQPFASIRVSLLKLKIYEKRWDSIDEIELRSEEHTSELQSRGHLVCRLLLDKKKKKNNQ